MNNIRKARMLKAHLDDVWLWRVIPWVRSWQRPGVLDVSRGETKAKWRKLTRREVRTLAAVGMAVAADEAQYGDGLGCAIYVDNLLEASSEPEMYLEWCEGVLPERRREGVRDIWRDHRRARRRRKARR